MRRHHLKPADREKLPSYPMTITVEGLSYCHEKPRILVQSKQGGLIKANCLECNYPTSITIENFKTIDKDIGCPLCEMVMVADHVLDGSFKERNYGFKCDKCAIYIWAYDLVPHYEDFPYSL